MIAASYISAISWFQPPPIGVLRIKRYIHTALKLGLVSIPIGVLRIRHYTRLSGRDGEFQSPLGFFESVENDGYALQYVRFNPHWGSSNIVGWIVVPKEAPFQSPLGFFESKPLLDYFYFWLVSIPIGVLRIIAKTLGHTTTAGFNPHWGSSNFLTRLRPIFGDRFQSPLGFFE